MTANEQKAWRKLVADILEQREKGGLRVDFATYTDDDEDIGYASAILAADAVIKRAGDVQGIRLHIKQIAQFWNNGAEKVAYALSVWLKRDK